MWNIGYSFDFTAKKMFTTRGWARRAGLKGCPAYFYRRDGYQQ
jgi:hypothetical protein